MGQLSVNEVPISSEAHSCEPRASARANVRRRGRCECSVGAGGSRTIVGLLMLLWFSTVIPASANEPSTSNAVAPDRSAAAEAVRKGNQRLQSGDANGALEAYEQADALAPDAREIAFVEGLAHYDLKAYDQARSAFEQAAGVGSDALAADARYSLGTCDHAEALETTDDPKLALILLEDAMRKYQSVLAEQPNHRAARDANLKAASMWRALKQQLERQPPQPQDSAPSDKNENQDEKNQDQQQSNDQQNQSSSDQQSLSQENQRQSASPDEQDQQQQKDQQRQAQVDQQERISREQAQRKLREMIQTIRERRKARREQVQELPVKPAEKDW